MSPGTGELSHLGEAQLGVSQREALVSGGVEVRLRAAVRDEGAVHLWGGNVQFVLLKEAKGRRINPTETYKRICTGEKTVT